MERINVTKAVRQFSDLLNRVHYNGVSVELERGNKAIARITPIKNKSSLKVKDLNKFFAALPSLKEDVENFDKDLKEIREKVPMEYNPWD